MELPEASGFQASNVPTRRRVRTRKKPEEIRMQFHELEPSEGEFPGRFKCRHCNSQEYIGWHNGNASYHIEKHHSDVWASMKEEEGKPVARDEKANAICFLLKERCELTRFLQESELYWCCCSGPWLQVNGRAQHKHSRSSKGDSFRLERKGFLLYDGPNKQVRKHRLVGVAKRIRDRQHKQESRKRITAMDAWIEDLTKENEELKMRQLCRKQRQNAAKNYEAQLHINDSDWVMLTDEQPALTVDQPQHMLNNILQEPIAHIHVLEEQYRQYCDKHLNLVSFVNKHVDVENDRNTVSDLPLLRRLHVHRNIMHQLADMGDTIERLNEMQHKIMDEITLLVAENDHLSTTLMQVHESLQADADVVNRRGVNVVVRQVKLDPTETRNVGDPAAMFKKAIDIEERNELKSENDEMIGLPPPQTMVEGSTKIQSFEVSEQLCVKVEARSATDSIKLPNYNADTQRDIQELQQFMLVRKLARKVIPRRSGAYINIFIAIIGIIIAILLSSVMSNGHGWLAGFVLGNILMFIATMYRLDRVFRRLWRARHASLDNIPYLVPGCDESPVDFESEEAYRNAVESLGVQLREPLAGHQWSTRVFTGHHVQSGRDVAVNIIRKAPDHNDKKGLDIEALKRFSKSSPHFIEFIDATETEHHTVIVMELCTRGNLSEFLQRVVSNAAYSDSLFRETSYTGCMFKILEVFVQIAHGLIDLHRQSLAYGAIRPQDILLSDREIAHFPCCKSHYTNLSRVFCLADFGILRHMTVGGSFYTSDGRGTAKYRAPEILVGRLFNGIKADTYSFGVMLYEALTSEAYANMEHVRTAECEDFIVEETFIGMQDLGGPARVPLYGWWSVNPAILSVLRSFLSPNPDERGSLEDFVNLFSVNSQRDITKTAAVPFEYHPVSLIGCGRGMQAINWITELKAEA